MSYFAYISSKIRQFFEYMYVKVYITSFLNIVHGFESYTNPWFVLSSQVAWVHVNELCIRGMVVREASTFNT